VSENLDLLGDPIPEGFGRRGRPPHVPNDEKRRLVIQLLAFDWSPERISAALSITPPTLRKHYFRELRVKAEARSRVEARLLGALMAEAEAGNVTAIDKYFKRFDRFDIAHAPKPEKEEKVGKKEQARRDARSQPESSWSTLLPN